MKNHSTLVLCFLSTNLLLAQEEAVEEVVVIGTKASLISAIDKQRESNKILSVVDSDALGEFPDTTAAEAIRRLSGISVENDQGEGRYVSIRGLSSDLNSIAVNGALMPAPEGNRSVMLDGLPTELLDSIEVSKSLTPDQDADSIGGRIDFKTKRPTDLEDMIFKLKVDTQYNENAESNDNPRFAITYGDKISDSAAHVFGFTYSSKQVVAYNNETGYGWETNSSGLKEMNDDWEMRYYDLTRERIGFTYDANLLTSDTTSIFLSAFYNEYIDDELRYKDEYGKLGSTGTTTQSSMSTDRVRHDAETRVREEIRTISAFSLGADTIVNDWDTSFQLSYSFAEQDDTDNADLTFRCDIEMGEDECIDLSSASGSVGQINWSNPKKPYLIHNYPQAYLPSNLKWKELELEDSVIEDAETALKIDFSKDVTVGGAPSVIKFGLKMRSREVEVDGNKEFYKDPAKRYLSDFGPVQLSWPFKNQTFGPQATPSQVIALQNQTASLELDEAETYQEDYNSTEDILAIYGMISSELENALLVYGVRVEQMDLEAKAFDQDGKQTYASQDHTFIAPSVNYKYFLNDNIIVRAAFSRSLSRPPFKATAPTLELDINDDEIGGSYGNPDLDPYESDNFDLSIEYYGDDLFYISVGTFLKDIDNAIYKTIQKTATINGISFNNGVNTWINADSSEIRGYELSFSRELSFLPEPFDGLFVAANLTFTDGDSTFNYEDNKTFTAPFRKLSDKQQNISIGYDKGPFDIRLAMNSRGDYLDWLADEEDDIDTVSLANSRYVGEHKQWDLKASYRLSDNLKIKFEIINIDDRPEYYYWGYTDRLSQYDEYGTSYAIGFTYKN